MKYPDRPPRSGRCRALASILPVIIVICGLCLYGVVPALLIRPRTDVIPVSLRSVLSADYSADRRNLSFSAVGLGLVQEYWLDSDLSPTEVAQRVSTLTVLLQTPVPTVTPLRGQSGSQPTSIPPSPTVVNREVVSPTPGLTSTVNPSATPVPSRTPTATASQTSSPSPTGTASPTLPPTASVTLFSSPSSTPTPTLLPSLSPTTVTPRLRTLPSHPTSTPSFTPPPATSTPLPTATPLPPTDPPPPPAASVPPTPELPAAAPPVGELSVTPLCSDHPDVERRWSITHTGAREVYFTWELLGQGSSGTGSIGAGASVILSTGAKPGATVIRVSAPGYQQVTAVNHGEVCSPNSPLPPSPPSETPTEVPTATLDPSPTASLTQTPEPSATEVPTATLDPSPTQTPEPSATPE